MAKASTVHQNVAANAFVSDRCIENDEDTHADDDDSGLSEHEEVPDSGESSEELDKPVVDT